MDITREEFDEVIDNCANAFDELINVINYLEPQKRKKYLCANGLGYFSAFLERGDGFEPVDSLVRTLSDLKDDLEENGSFEEEAEEE